MAGVNKVILVGNLGADPEIRHLESGSKVANISIATSETYVKDGERIEQTEWHKVELWDRLADLCEKYLSKGRTVYIEGRIRTNTYQDKDGVTRYDKRIRATNMTFIGGRSDEDNTHEENTGDNPQAKSSANPGSAQPAAQRDATQSDSDDLPF